MKFKAQKILGIDERSFFAYNETKQKSNETLFEFIK